MGGEREGGRGIVKKNAKTLYGLVIMECKDIVWFSSNVKYIYIFY